MVIWAPLRWLGPPKAPCNPAEPPSKKPNRAGNLSPRHAAVLSTLLIQSFPCHYGTGRALIEFIQQQKSSRLILYSARSFAGVFEWHWVRKMRIINVSIIKFLSCVQLFFPYVFLCVPGWLLWPCHENPRWSDTKMYVAAIHPLLNH